MPCFHPITAWQSPPGYIGQHGKSISFRAVPGFNEILLPCGQCVGCRLERSRQWALRCVHEASLYEDNCFITLTYDDDHLPPGGSLQLDDIQNFFKRFRDRISPCKLRFFQCGEYGSLLSRPHHHACIFGYDFPDKQLFFRSSAGLNVWRSPLLEDLWPFGYSSIGELTFESAAYTARYIMKKINGDAADEHYQGRKPEFITMSRRPGIGADFAKKYFSDMYPKDFITIKGGIRCRPAKFYDRLYDALHHDQMREVKENRVRFARDHNLALENTPERLAVKEEHKILTIKQLKRNLEI